MKAQTTWFLLANGANGRIVENRGVGKGIAPVENMVFRTDVKHAGDILADRPGRVFDSGGAGRHSMEYGSDPVREIEKQFATTLCTTLAEARAAKKFDRLVVVAAPQTLGDLRAVMDADVKNSVHAEIAKDLTHVPDQELPAHLDKVIAL